MIAVICILIRTYVCFVVVPRREIERNDNKTKPSKIFTIGVILTIVKRFVDFKEVLMKSTKEKHPSHSFSVIIIPSCMYAKAHVSFLRNCVRNHIKNEIKLLENSRETEIIFKNVSPRPNTRRTYK